MKATTEQVRASENKKVLQKIDYEVMASIYDELKIIETSLRALVGIANTTKDERLKVSILQWLIEVKVPKPKQEVDVTSKGEQITGILFQVGESLQKIIKNAEDNETTEEPSDSGNGVSPVQE
jgi:ferritin